MNNHAPDQSAKIGRILIADDDEAFRRLLVLRASRMGLEIIEATDGEEAIKAVRTQAFDVIVLDLSMPGASGIEVLLAGRRTDKDLQAIILTANATLESAIEALRAGAYDYLTKPLDSLAVFELALTRALEHRHLLHENARLFAEVQRLAVTDPLTGLFNRHKLNEALESEIERARRYDRPLSVMMIDMDDLKHINDTYGHAAGDEVLKRVADIIRNFIRKVDVPTRFGGDEFVVILPEADIKESARVAARIHEQGREMSYDKDQISFSIGVIELHEGVETPEQFLHEVDQVLYLAKHENRGGISTGESLLSGEPESGSSTGEARSTTAP